MKLRYLSLLLVLVVARIFAEDNLEIFLTSLQNQYKLTKTLQFDFIQEIRPGDHNQPQKVSGKFYFRSPDKMRLESGDHQPIIIFDKKKIWLYDPATHQALESSQEFLSGVGGIGQNFIFTSWSEKQIADLKENYNFTLTFDSPTYCLTLIPKLSGGDLPLNFSLKIYFSEPDLVPERNILTLTRAGEQIISTMEIKNFQRNKNLSDELFRLPRSVEIIRPGKD